MSEGDPKGTLRVESKGIEAWHDWSGDPLADVGHKGRPAPSGDRRQRRNHKRDETGIIENPTSLLF